MTSVQYRAALRRLHLSQVGAARLLGIDGTTSRRWAKHGVRGIPAILLELMAARVVTVEQVKAARASEQLPGSRETVA